MLSSVSFVGQAVARRLALVPTFLVVFLPLVLLFAATTTRDTSVLSPDPVGTALPAWQLAENGTLTLDDPPVKNVWLDKHDGRLVSNRMPGVIAAGVPFYLLARPFTDGFTMWPAAIAAATLAAGAMGVLALVLQTLIGRRAAIGAALVGGVATGTWSVSGDALWPHSVNQLLLAVAMLGMVRRQYLVTGLALMLAEPVRTHLAVVALVLGVVAALREHRLRPLLQVGVPAVLGVLAVMLYTRYLIGVVALKPQYNTLAGPVVDTTSSSTATNLAGFFFSPDRGLLAMSPFLLVLLPGLRAGWRAAPAWVRASSVAGIAYLVVQARLNHFSGGVHFWGYRLGLESLTLFAPLLALAWRERIRPDAARRQVLAALTCFSVALHAVGALLYTPVPPTPDWRHWWPLHLLAEGPHKPAAAVILLLGCAGAVVCLLATPERRAALRPRFLVVSPYPVAVAD